MKKYIFLVILLAAVGFVHAQEKAELTTKQLLETKNFIFKAAKRNENEFILYMLTLNNVLPSISINMLDKKNQSLLMIAVKNKNLVLAKRLVELGAAYDKKTKVILIQMKIIPSDAEITHKPNLFVDNAKQDTEEKSEEKLPNRLQYRK